MRNRPGWRPVQVFLTDQRLIFYQAPKIRLGVSLGDIRNLRVGREYYVLKQRDYLGVSYDSRDGLRKGEVLLIVNRLGEWKENIFRLSLLKIDENVIQTISAQLDSDGRDILWYLWEKRHARINELADLIDARSHMHVLLLIKETINPVGEKIVGCPILSFERSKPDPERGEPVLFSWWLVGERERCVPNDRRILDIFDEGAHIHVIMEVRGVKKSDIRLDLEDDQLTVRSHKLGASLRERVRLPTAVTLDRHQISLKNNFLEIRLPKTGTIRRDLSPSRGPLRSDQ